LTTGFAFASPAGAKPLVSGPTQAGITASFIKSQHLLKVFGDAGANSISVGRDSAGVITINGSDVVIGGAKETVANVDKIAVFAGALR
jgi:hypothetical protein